MIKLGNSPVEFDRASHCYKLLSIKLSGITRLIHDVLSLGNYDEAGDYVKNVLVPKAGERGSAVHTAIEYYDHTGLRSTKSKGKFGQYNVSLELESYIKLRNGYTPIANEYTVSDCEKWASNIDNVWLKDGTDEIWLADTKTNNKDLYPGGSNALKEYLSWQLSIYAYLFELQNPTLKVAGLLCNWLKNDKYEQWIIDRKPDDQVKWLLSCNYDINDDECFCNYRISIPPHFNIDYSKPDKNEKSAKPIATISELPAFTKEAVEIITSVQREYEESKKLLDEMKEKLREAMEANHIKSWDSGMFKATIAQDSTSVKFDVEKFKEENPKLYDEYLKESPRKGGFTIKLKKEKNECK